MKKLGFGLIFIFCVTILPAKALAHGNGFPPFFLINGKSSPPSPIQMMGVTVENIITPQDIANEVFLPNQEISFTINTDKLKTVYPQDVLNNIRYSWDFGDGDKGTGLENKHAYKKPGSYILAIQATPDATVPMTLIESVQINVVPHKGYHMPQANIQVNTSIVKNPLQDVIKADFQQTVTFDASKSESSSSRIVSYMWDFGDGEKSAQPIITHSYTSGQKIATPYLRVIDANGLVSDTFVTVENTPMKDTSIPYLHIALGVVVGVGLIGILVVFILKKITSA